MYPISNDILRFNISMHYFLSMHVLDSNTDLFNPNGRIFLVESSLSFHEFMQSIVNKDLHNQVYILLIIKHSVQSN
jgi:hypothetical protein